MGYENRLDDYADPDGTDLNDPPPGQTASHTGVYVMLAIVIVFQIVSFIVVQSKDADVRHELNENAGFIRQLQERAALEEARKVRNLK